MPIKQSEVKKKVVKKSESKSVASKSVKAEKRALAHAQGEQCFWTNDGRIVSNLVELSDVLASMDIGVFQHHVNRERNDFAEWIQAVLDDAELAQSLRSAKKPDSARAIVIRRLKIYNV